MPLNYYPILIQIILMFQNSVRHNLSLNKCFAKVETPKMTGNNSKKGCLWALNPDKVEKMEDEIAKHRKKDLESIRMCMPKPGQYFNTVRGTTVDSSIHCFGST